MVKLKIPPPPPPPPKKNKQKNPHTQKKNKPQNNNNNPEVKRIESISNSWKQQAHWPHKVSGKPRKHFVIQYFSKNNIPQKIYFILFGCTLYTANNTDWGEALRADSLHNGMPNYSQTSTNTVQRTQPSLLNSSTNFLVPVSCLMVTVQAGSAKIHLRYSNQEQQQLI